ncbi:MAG: diacylglycerol kinase family protein [Bacteroidetes bacterium]|nr:diacylglycerol kinase family protein [Bacteroidota bacterium]
MKRLIDSFGYAFRGVGFALTGQRNMKIHFTAALIVLAAGLRFEITAMEWCVVATTIGIVMAAELFNTAIEHLVDLVSPERNALAGKVKDIAAGAVLVTALMAIVVGVLIFGKYIVG